MLENAVKNLANGLFGGILNGKKNMFFDIYNFSFK